MASLSGAFSGLLAYAIVNMHGIGKLPGWSWIFILEGLFTILFGLVAYWLLPPTPADARFLNEKEKAYVVARLRDDGATGRGDEDKFSWYQVREAFLLPQVWMLSVVCFCAGTRPFALSHLLRIKSLNDIMI